MAIVRHEFYQKFGVASAPPLLAIELVYPTLAKWSSPCATTRRVVAMTTPVLRPDGGAPPITIAPRWSRRAGALQRLTVALRRGRSSLLWLDLPVVESSPARASWRPCSA